MKYIHGISNDPAFNLAFEEYIFEKMDPEEDLFMLWQNDNAIIVGKYQNTIEEINLEYIKEKNIKVVRRLTGGGAVYHDLGNLNFTFITHKKDLSNFDFQFFIKKITQALDKLGITAEFNGRNDITINGRKFSGNSQYAKGGRILHHGTILFDSDKSIMQNALNVKTDKIESKGVKSVKSHVTNIIDHLDQKVSLQEFETVLLNALFEEISLEEIHLNRDAIEAIEKIRDEKYNTWEWNFGKSPAFDLKKEHRFSSGSVSLLIKATHSMIDDLHIYGDFFGNGDIKILEDALKGINFEEKAVRTALESYDVSHFINGVDNGQFAKLLLY